MCVLSSIKSKQRHVTKLNLFSKKLRVENTVYYIRCWNSFSKMANMDRTEKFEASFISTNIPFDHNKIFCIFIQMLKSKISMQFLGKFAFFLPTTPNIIYSRRALNYLSMASWSSDEPTKNLKRVSGKNVVVTVIIHIWDVCNW